MKASEYIDHVHPEQIHVAISIKISKLRLTVFGSRVSDPSRRSFSLLLWDKDLCADHDSEPSSCLSDDLYYPEKKFVPRVNQRYTRIYSRSNHVLFVPVSVWNGPHLAYPLVLDARVHWNLDDTNNQARIFKKQKWIGVVALNITTVTALFFAPPRF